MNLDLKNYLNGENSICREERQYALFLYNILAGQKEITIDEQVYTIEQVCYEASFMRDFFNYLSDEEKIEFNKELMQFANKKDCLMDMNEFDKKIFLHHINQWSKNEKNKEFVHPIAQFMMNAKPDISILVSKDNQYILHFIECKYVSTEGNYTKKIDGKKYHKKQTEIQKYILEFLCERMKMRYGNEQEDIQPGNVIMCCFKGKWKSWKDKNVVPLEALFEKKEVEIVMEQGNYAMKVKGETTDGQN